MYEEVIDALRARIESDLRNVTTLNEDSARKGAEIAENNDRILMLADRIDSYEQAIAKLEEQ